MLPLETKGTKNLRMDNLSVCDSSLLVEDASDKTESHDTVNKYETAGDRVSIAKVATTLDINFAP